MVLCWLESLIGFNCVMIHINHRGGVGVCCWVSEKGQRIRSSENILSKIYDAFKNTKDDDGLAPLRFPRFNFTWSFG